MKRTTFTLLLCLAVSSFSAFAQGWQWGKKVTNSTFRVSTECMHVASDTDGNSYMAGVTVSSSHLLAGVVCNFGAYSVTDSTSNSQSIVTKLNAAGVYQWVLATQNCSSGIAGLATDYFGNLFVLGVYDSVHCTFGGYPLSHGPFTNPASVMYFLAKINSTGTVLWAKNVVPTWCTAGGVGSPPVFAYVPNGGVHTDPAGNVYVSGEFVNPTVSVGSITLTKVGGAGALADIFNAKFDSSGNVIWARSYGSSSHESIAGTAGGKCAKETYVTGAFSGTTLTMGAHSVTGLAGNMNNYVAKFDSVGNPVWMATADTLSIFHDVAVDGADNVYLTGEFKTSHLSFGSQTATNCHRGKADIFITRYNSLGAPIWTRSAGGDSSDAGISITADNCNNIWITGTLSDHWWVAHGYTAHFGSLSIVNPSTTGFLDDPIFIAGYDSSGAAQMAMEVLNGGDDAADISVDYKGNFFVGGDWTTGNFLFGHDTFTRDSGNEYMFIAKFTYDSGGCSTVNHNTVEVLHRDIKLTLQPNPATENCAIHFEGTLPEDSKLLIFDMTGRLVSSLPITDNNTLFPVTGWRPGIYQVRVSVSGHVLVTEKLLVMP